MQRDTPVATTNEGDTPRESIWSISRRWVVIYYVLFSVQVTTVISLVAWREIFHNTDDSAVDTVLAIGEGTSPHIITIAADSLVIVLGLEVTTMLAERYLRRRYREGREEGIEEGRREGRKEAEAEIRKFREWNRRREDAMSKGEAFDEPFPDYDEGRSGG